MRGFVSHLLTVAVGSLALSVGLLGQTALTPTLLSLSPGTAPVGAAGLTLTVTGTNFLSGSIVSWNQIILTTTSFVGTTQLTATVPAFLLSAPGTARVVVLTPGGTQSNFLTFTIAGSPVTISTAAVPSGSVGAAYSIALT